MKNHFLLFLFAAPLFTAPGRADEPRDLYADTWAATDALGRTLPLGSEVRAPQKDKFAAMFYYLWQQGGPGPFDISKALAGDPKNPQLGPRPSFHWWGEPEAGYYRADDPWVIRRNLSMLSDAGIDVIFFDVTNAFTYLDTVKALCETAMAMRKEGNKTPQIGFLTNARAGRTQTELFNEFYAKNLYRELWFMWDGKPLMLGNINGKNDDGSPTSDELKNFFSWREGRGFHEIENIGPVVVAAYIKSEKERRGPNGVQTVKVELAAIRRLFDYLVIGQVMAFNPALSVRGPKHVVTKGKTPVLDGTEAKRLIESIPTQRKDGSPDLVGLRDRALISLMTYSLARVSAALKMEVRDYRPQGKRFKVQLHEKGGKLHEVPVHHKAEEYLDAYIEAAGIGDQARGPLWRKGLKRTGTLQNIALTRFDAFHMIRRRAAAAGISEEICCHTFRATGITVYRKNGGTLADAQQIAGHSSARTTQLYDRSEHEISLEEIERIRL